MIPIFDLTSGINDLAVTTENRGDGIDEAIRQGNIIDKNESRKVQEAYVNTSSIQNYQFIWLSSSSMLCSLCLLMMMVLVTMATD